MTDPFIPSYMLREALLILTVTGQGYTVEAPGQIEVGRYPQHVCQAKMDEAVQLATEFGYRVEMVQCRGKFYAPAHSLRPPNKREGLIPRP